MITGVALVLFVAAAPSHVLSLAEAERTARANQPQLRQQRATTRVREAQSDVVRAALLPQLTGTVSYQRASSRAPTIGVARNLGGANFWNTNLNLSVPIYDFGQSLGSWRSAQATAESQRESEITTQQQVVLTVRLTFFQARAQRALVQVAKDTLANQRLHQKQIQGFVTVGTRPPIDLAQARTNVANADLQRIQAENNYLVSRAQLNQVMGVVAPIDFEVADETLAPIAGEDGSTEALVKRALLARPELAALVKQQEAQRQTIRSFRGAYYPALGFGAAVSESGVALTEADLFFNWSVGLTLTWQIFSGLQTRSQVRAARASLDAVDAQLDAQAQQVRLDVITAVLGLTGAKAASSAAIEARKNARELLRLAEGRYATGVGNGVELSDAQTAATQAEAQVIQAEFNLAAARARLLSALGQR